MDIVLVPLIQLVSYGLNLYTWAVIIYCLLNLLTSFDVINPYSQFVQLTGQFLSRLVDPLLNYVRRVIPSFGTVDLSPLILIFIIYLLQGILNQILLKL